MSITPSRRPAKRTPRKARTDHARIAELESRLAAAEGRIAALEGQLGLVLQQLAERTPAPITYPGTSPCEPITPPEPQWPQTYPGTFPQYPPLRPEPIWCGDDPRRRQLTCGALAGGKDHGPAVLAEEAHRDLTSR